MKNKIDRRNDFTLYTILTELNSVTIDITSTLADQFEKIFQNELDNLKGKKLKFVNTSIFDGFILNIQNFLFFAPLSRKK